VGVVWILIIGLRHDVDTVYGLRRGLPKLITIERKYGVRSTIFVRVDIIRSDRDKRFLRMLIDEEWEIGLHLINTINDPKLMSPQEELNRLRSLLGIQVYGVTPCGSTIGFKGDVTWKTMDSLGLKYMEGYGIPGFKCQTYVMPTHLSFDIYYIRKWGEEKGYQKFKEDLILKLEKDGLATVLTHPEWFVRSVGGSGLMKIPLTLLRIKMMNKVYEKFICNFKEKVSFKRYIDLFNYIKKRE